MIIGKLKTYGLILLSGLVGILALVSGVLGRRSKRLKIEKEFLDARIRRDVEIMERDNELQGQTDSRRAQAARDDSIASDPNQLWGAPDDSE